MHQEYHTHRIINSLSKPSMKRPLPLIAIPGHTQVFPLGTPTPPRSSVSPLLRFFVKGLQLGSEGDDGLAIVGHGEGRRRLVQVSFVMHSYIDRV